MQKIISLYTGLPHYQADIDTVTAIKKSTVNSALYVDENGVTGDGVGDTKRHGGTERVLHQYPSENYHQWLERINLAPHAPKFKPSLFGENISSSGMNEKDTYIGDIYRIGSALLQVSQPRKPCWKLNWRTEVANASLFMQTSGLTGWFYRVIEPGFIEPGDSITLVERAPQPMSIFTIVSELYAEVESAGDMTVLNQTALHEIAENSLLSENWRKVARERLKTGVIENWHHRLFGPTITV